MPARMKSPLSIKRETPPETPHFHLIRFALLVSLNVVFSNPFYSSQVKKLQDRVAKAKDEVQKTKEKYEQSLREINEYNPKYMEDMTTVFEKCQEFEEKRLKFFKEMLFSIHGCLNISNMPDVVRIYEEYRHTIQSADASKDLKYWSNTHGVGMAMNWPIFEVGLLLSQNYFCQLYTAHRGTPIA